jgi:flagellar protein FliO/FliZ
MVKRRLISGWNINLSFTKPAQLEPFAPEWGRAVEVLDWARTLFALVATLALIGGAAYGARRLGMLQPGPQGPRRLKVIESLMLDPRRRMVIVRCDDREHVLVLSPAGDIVIVDLAAKAQARS